MVERQPVAAVSDLDPEFEHWPHDRGHLLWVERAPTARLQASIARWSSALLADDGIESVVPVDGRRRSAQVKTRRGGILAGAAVVDSLLREWTPGASWTWHALDGEVVRADTVLLDWEASDAQLLALERPMLNILDRLSGVASETGRWRRDLREVERDATPAPLRRAPLELSSTRKTVWGLLDKWAVSLAGGFTHRLDRTDALMLKENDLAAQHPSLTPVERVRRAVEDLDPEASGAFAEVEVRRLSEGLAAGEAWCKRRRAHPATPRLVLMLDNLGPRASEELVGKLDARGLRRHLVVEGSGGVRRSELLEWWRSGVDVLSASAIHRGTMPLDLTCLVDGA